MNQVVKLVFVVWGFSACSSPSNKRGINLDELDSVQAEDAKALSAPARDALTATELLELADCNSLQCVQLFMKDLSGDFVHASKGEFAALHRSVVTDTAGRPLVIPLSTLYVDVNPQASWRMAHTVHRADLGNRLLEEFYRLGFTFIDSGYYRGAKNKQGRFSSPEYPGKTLYVTAAYNPWPWKSLYQKATWLSMVFEVYNDK